MRSHQTAETLDDIRADDEAKRHLAEGEELIPATVTFALLVLNERYDETESFWEVTLSA